MPPGMSCVPHSHSRARRVLSSSNRRLRLPVLYTGEALRFSHAGPVKADTSNTAGKLRRFSTVAPRSRPCEDCGKPVTTAYQRAHLCYRRRNGLKIHACKHCSAEFISPGALAKHVKSRGDAPHQSDDIIATYSVPSEDLTAPSSRFSAFESVCSQKLIHATDPQSGASIMKERAFRGGRATVYDGVLFSRSGASPASVFTEVRSASEGSIFPYSFYPVSVPVLDDVSIFSIDMDFLLHADYRMFYNKTSPTQFGPRFKLVAMSQVVFVHCSESEALEFAVENFVELDKRKNALVRYIDEEGWEYATRFTDNNTVRPHRLVVVLLGGLRFDALDVNVEHMLGRRAGLVDYEFPCTETGCNFRARSTGVFKEHFLRSHGHGDRTFVCSHDGCCHSARTRKDLEAHEGTHSGGASDIVCERCIPPRTFSRSSSLRTHEAVVHEGERPWHCERCDQRFGYKSHLSQHIRSVHEGARDFRCDLCGDEFSQRGNLRVHMERKHSDLALGSGRMMH